MSTESALSFLDALSPLDGRYAGKLADLRAIFSEAGLMRERVRVEAAWLLALHSGPARHSGPLAEPALSWLRSLASDPKATDVAAIKAIEARTNHDVKAVEYWLRAELARRGVAPAQLEWVHFSCTSEDINNLAYALMLQRARAECLLPALRGIGESIDAFATSHAAVPMLARTHGQAATPTTVGKEFANVSARLARQISSLAGVEILGKINGAVGNYNAHVIALPEIDWRKFAEAFVVALGLGFNSHTTQIEPHDWIAEYCHALLRANTVLTDFSRDVWGYISLGYFKQRVVAGEVGSSTMPHKVNPIDFENAEGNLGLANALLAHFAEKLPLSRWQRDLTDSTVLRNVGVALGHAMLAFDSLQKGLGKIEIDSARLTAELQQSWEVLTEAIQTVMRAHGVADAYDRLKALSRGRPLDQAALQSFIADLALPEAAKARLLALTPARYIGLAAELALRKPS
jgi:adenylosuccinate lyase